MLVYQTVASYSCQSSPTKLSTKIILQATEDAGDVVMPGTLWKNHLVLQVPQKPRQVGRVHILKVLRSRNHGV